MAVWQEEKRKEKKAKASKRKQKKVMEQGLRETGTDKAKEKDGRTIGKSSF